MVQHRPPGEIRINVWRLARLVYACGANIEAVGLSGQFGAAMLAYSSERASSGANCYVLIRDWVVRAREVVENMVARDGVEPPTPAFSERRFRVFTTR